MSTTTVAMAGIATPAVNTAVSKVSPPSTSSSVKFNIRASSQSQETTSRRAFINILTAAAPAVLFAKEALADANVIKLGGPPPPSGGLPGTDSADQARNLELPLKQRFYLQPLPPAEALARAKESVKDIASVKALIDKKAWPYVQNDLRLKAEYLRLDLSTAVKSKSSAERKALKPLLNQVFQNINDLDFAARKKSVENAEKYYAITVSSLNDLIAKLG